MLILIVLLCIGLVIVATWAVIFIYLHRQKYPLYPLDEIKSLLVVFPHPDDEVLTCAGLVHTLRRKQIPVHIVFLTQGECGTSDAHWEETLGPIRVIEAQLATSHLRSTVQVENLGDGQLQNKRQEVHDTLRSIIEHHSPSHVITYDLSGLYGHNDHIAVSEELTGLILDTYPSITLLYATFPHAIMKHLHLPIHMASGNLYQNVRSLPTHKVSVSKSIVAKINALYAHRSQYRSFRGIFPLQLVPLWMLTSLGMYEYFVEANPKKPYGHMHTTSDVMVDKPAEQNK